MNIRKNIFTTKANKGKYRVSAYDPYDYDRYVIDEFDNIESALALVKEKSLKATSTPSMYSDIYFIYNDQDIALYKSNFDDGLIKIENG
jgi:hypothetical protein